MINHLPEKKYSWKKTKEDNFEYGDVLVYKSYPENVFYRYRIDPIPHTRKHRGGPIEHKKYYSILKMIKNPENKGYVRIKHYQGILDTSYDWDYYNNRTLTKSWKDNKKVRKQWQKNLK